MPAIISPDPSQPRWRKSSYSGNQGQCVELAWLPSCETIRDSKNPVGVIHVDLTLFLAEVKVGRFSV
ncbi:MAG: DUF397 domain-containing protein [Candidatus Dormibacteraceae bacterium]